MDENRQTTNLSHSSSISQKNYINSKFIIIYGLNKNNFFTCSICMEGKSGAPAVEINYDFVCVWFCVLLFPDQTAHSEVCTVCTLHWFRLAFSWYQAGKMYVWEPRIEVQQNFRSTLSQWLHLNFFPNCLKSYFVLTWESMGKCSSKEMHGKMKGFEALDIAAHVTCIFNGYECWTRPLPVTYV